MYQGSRVTLWCFITLVLLSTEGKHTTFVVCFHCVPGTFQFQHSDPCGLPSLTVVIYYRVLITNLWMTILVTYGFVVSLQPRSTKLGRLVILDSCNIPNKRDKENREKELLNLI